MRILMVYNAINSVFALIVGVRQYSDSCSNPLPLWLIIQAVFGIAQNVLSFVQARVQLRLQTDGYTEADAATLYRWYGPLRIVLGLLLLGQLAWVAVGSVWTWTTSNSKCTSVIYGSASGVLVGTYVLFVIILLIALKRKFCPRDK